MKICMKPTIVPETRNDSTEPSTRAERIEQLGAQILDGTYSISAEAVAEKESESLELVK